MNNFFQNITLPLISSKSKPSEDIIVAVDAVMGDHRGYIDKKLECISSFWVHFSEKSPIIDLIHKYRRLDYLNQQANFARRKYERLESLAC